MGGKKALTKGFLPALLFVPFLSSSPGFAQDRSDLPECKQANRYRAPEPYSAFLERTQRSKCRREWTTLVYMAADNDLSPYAGWDLYEMEAGFKEKDRLRAASTDRMDVIVQVDTFGDRGVKRLHMFQSPEVYTKKSVEDFSEGYEDRLTSPVIESLPEMDSADAGRLRDFLRWGMEHYPAKYTFVVLWGHGQGWIPARRRTKRDPEEHGGVAFDFTSNTVMDIPSLHEALGSTRSKVDVFAADACLMQMGEVVTELSDAARYFVGTTQISTLLGLPYRRLFWEMNKGSYLKLNKEAPPTADKPYLLAKMIPSLFEKSLDAQRGLQGRIDPEAYGSLTSSSVHGDEFTRFAIPALKKLSASIKTWLKEAGKDARRADLLGALEDPDVRSYEGSARDLSSFLARLAVLLRFEEEFGQSTDASKTLLDSINGVRGAIDQSLINYQLGSEYVEPEGQLYLLSYRALSIWIPFSRDEYKSRVRAFTSSRFYKETAWSDWMDELFR